LPAMLAAQRRPGRRLRLEAHGLSPEPRCTELAAAAPSGWLTGRGAAKAAPGWLPVKVAAADANHAPVGSSATSRAAGLISGFPAR
jgi:hypothetical protein